MSVRSTRAGWLLAGAGLGLGLWLCAAGTAHGARAHGSGRRSARPHAAKRAMPAAGLRADRSTLGQGTLPRTVDGIAAAGYLAWDGLTVAPGNLDASGNLKVAGAMTGGGGTQYSAGAIQATPVGTVALGIGPSNVLSPLALDGSQLLKVGIYAIAGNTAAGSAVTANPITVGGKDSSGNVQNLQTDTSGRLNVVSPDGGSPGVGATTDAAPVSHDHQGSAVAHLRDIAIELGNVTGTIGAGSAAANSVAAGAVYSSSTSAPTNGQQVGLQVDATGRLAVTQIPPWATPEQYFNVSISDNSSHTVFAAQAALNGGLAQRHWITNILVVNHSTSVATKVEILDGATAIWGGGAGINDGGWSFAGASGPLRQPTTDQALAVECLTSGADVTVSIQGYYAP